MSIPPIAHKARAVRSRGEHSTSRFVRCQILDPSFPVALQVQYELAAKAREDEQAVARMQVRVGQTMLLGAWVVVLPVPPMTTSHSRSTQLSQHGTLRFACAGAKLPNTNSAAPSAQSATVCT